MRVNERLAKLKKEGKDVIIWLSSGNRWIEGKIVEVDENEAAIQEKKEDKIPCYVYLSHVSAVAVSEE